MVFCDAVKYTPSSNSWQEVKNLFPSKSMLEYTLCTTQLSMVILKRMRHELSLDFFDGIFSDGDEDYFESSNDSSSSSDHFEFEPSDDGALFV